MRLCPVCGGIVNIEIEVPNGSILLDCRFCGGTGSILDAFTRYSCPVCKGIGKNKIDAPSQAELTDCRFCNGTGIVLDSFIRKPCPACKGTGFLPSKKRISLDADSRTPRKLSIKKHECFIGYGEPDKYFAHKLKEALNTKEITAWVYSLDYTPGKRTWEEIITKRRNSRKVLFICSTLSLKRDALLKEIEQQIDEEPEKIIPVSIDISWTEPTFYIKRGSNDLKPFLIQRNYADFVTKPFDYALDKLADAIKQG